MRVAVEMRRLTDELSILTQVSFHNTVAQNDEIIASYDLVQSRLSEASAQHGEVMRALFEVFGIPEK